MHIENTNTVFAGLGALIQMHFSVRVCLCLGQLCVYRRDKVNHTGLSAVGNLIVYDINIDIFSLLMWLSFILLFSN